MAWCMSEIAERSGEVQGRDAWSPDNGAPPTRASSRRGRGCSSRICSSHDERRPERLTMSLARWPDDGTSELSLGGVVFVEVHVTAPVLAVRCCLRA
jgi:hypothetical protein